MATKGDQIRNLVKALGGEPRNSTIEDAIEDLVDAMPVEWHEINSYGYAYGRAYNSSMPDWDTLKNIMSTKNPGNIAIVDLIGAAGNLLHPAINSGKNAILSNFLSAGSDLLNAGIEFPTDMSFKVAYTNNINHVKGWHMISIGYMEAGNIWVISDPDNNNDVVKRSIQIKDGVITKYNDYFSMTSPNGTTYRISISDDGTFTSVKS